MIVDLLFIVAAVAVLIAIYKIKFSKENLQKEIHEATKKVQEKENIAQPQQSKSEDLSTNLNQNQEGSRWDNEPESEESQQDGQTEIVDRKKQLRKEQKQKEKQDRKEAQQYYLEQQKEKREKYEKQVEQRQRIEEQRRKKEEQIIEQLRQQQRKRKQEQFNKWKDMFKVQQSGKQKLSAEEQRRKIEEFNNSLLTLLKKNKLLLLEDLSHKFKLPIKELVEKIKALQASGQVSGIFDERGKYLVIQDHEWAAIRNYISARGRVKKTDIMNECARLIKIPENVEEELLNLVKQESV